MKPCLFCWVDKFNDSAWLMLLALWRSLCWTWEHTTLITWWLIILTLLWIAVVVLVVVPKIKFGSKCFWRGYREGKNKSEIVNNKK